MKDKILIISVVALLAAMSSCKKENTPAENSGLIRFEVIHPSIQTKATETSFELGDKVGVFMTSSSSILEPSGNYVNNLCLTYDGSKWTMPSLIYWNNGIYNVYGYYPYSDSVSSVDDYPFSVQLDQSTVESYKASDFLWTSAKKVSASSESVKLQFAHKMSRMHIRLVKSSSYEGAIPEDAEVYIHNVVAESTIDLAVGYPTKDPRASRSTIKALNLGGNCYSAMIVPQRIDSKVPLVEVLMDGVSYLYEAKFLFKTGIQHNVDLTISKNPSQIKISIGGEIDNW